MFSEIHEDDFTHTKANIYQRLQNATANQEYEVSRHERRKSNQDSKSDRNKDQSIDNRIFNNMVLRDKAPNLIDDFILKTSQTDRTENKLESARMLKHHLVTKHDINNNPKKEYYASHLDVRPSSSERRLQGLKIRFKSEERIKRPHNTDVNSLANEYQEAKRSKNNDKQLKNQVERHQLDVY